MKTTLNWRRSRLSAMLAVLLSFSLIASPALAAKDNAAIAINTEDGSSVFRFAFDVHRTMNQVVDETNIAVAYASCEGCQTVAIAIQIVLVSSNPDSVVPQNVSISLNQECISCDTLSSAYQFVEGGGPTKLDKEGRKRIKEIRKAFYDLAKEAESGQLSNAEIFARVEELAAQIKVVLDNHLVRADTPEEEEEAADGQGAEGTDGGGQSSESDSGATSEPTEKPSEDPSTTPTATSTPEPAASQTSNPNP